MSTPILEISSLGKLSAPWICERTCWINDLAPTAMIMCPCEDGLSHNEAEEISKEWAQAGTDVLLHAVLNTAIIQ